MNNIAELCHCPTCSFSMKIVIFFLFSGQTQRSYEWFRRRFYKSSYSCSTAIFRVISFHFTYILAYFRWNESFKSLKIYLLFIIFIFLFYFPILFASIVLILSLPLFSASSSLKFQFNFLFAVFYSLLRWKQIKMRLKSMKKTKFQLTWITWK